MELILTHQNADFDAVASMLGAYKLNPQAIPVLPSRLHAGVREFLALYRNGLPFMAWEDFRPRKIERIIITDTDHRLDIKGVSATIPTIIIEHHPLERELKAHETWAGEIVGAATTLLVERIREQGIPINSLEATLMALGIYADTGNFSYGGTTIRDMQAATWLLEQGAVLDTIRRFLSSPLNAEQQDLLEKLMETAENRQIMGYELTLCTAETDKHIDSINSVVAVLRDIWDSDALFAVIAMPNFCQLICRSTVDGIDVGELAKQFGGGGHPRASAAAIFKQSKESIIQAIWNYLQSHIQSPSKIADLMSYGVQTVEAHEKIIDIIQRIRRIGHEGYPVLDAGEVVGLLTLRDADKTLEHGLITASVREVMLGGRVTLRPDDPVSLLEARMVESDWGQIPVVNGENKLLGIVTRTDLIKHWGKTHPSSLPAAPRLSAEKVEAVLGTANEALIEIIAAFAHARDIALYMVGGVVRDLLLQRPNFDIDFVVEDDAIRFAEALKNTYGGRIHPYPPFGTATWTLDEAVAERLGLDLAKIPHHLDFATTRSELYEHPTALPTVYNSGIKLDLRRRDFTINTLAVQLSPIRAMWQILDFYGGMADLETKLIRVLHSLSFVDDPTRILRAVRFGERLQFIIEPRTAELVASALPTLKRITGERLQNELSLLLKEPNAARGILKLEALGVLGAIHPAFHAHPNFAVLMARMAEAYPQWEADEQLLRWHLLMADIPSEKVPEIAQRLLISHPKAEAMRKTAQIVENPALLLDGSPVSALVDLLSPLSKESLVALWLYWEESHIRQRIEAYVMKWQQIKPFTDGNALKARGLKPSPAFGQILQRLRQAWLDSLISSQDEEDVLLAQLIEELGDDGA